MIGENSSSPSPRPCAAPVARRASGPFSRLYHGAAELPHHQAVENRRLPGVVTACEQRDARRQQGHSLILELLEPFQGDGFDLCTTFWHPDGTPMSAQQFMETALRQAAGILQERSRTPRPVERAGHAEEAACRVSPRKALAVSNWPRCRRSSTPRRATSSTCWPMWPTPCRRSPAKNGPKSQGHHQHALQQQAAGLPRLRAVALRERRRGGTRPGEAHAACCGSSTTTPSPTPWPIWAGRRKSARCSQASRNTCTSDR